MGLIFGGLIRVGLGYMNTMEGSYGLPIKTVPVDHVGIGIQWTSCKKVIMYFHMFVAK